MNLSKDLHICGICKEIFNDIKLFLEHKEKCFHSEYSVTLSPISPNICVSLEENELLSNETVLDLTVLEGVSLPLVLEYDNEEVVTAESILENLEESSNQEQLSQVVTSNRNTELSTENLNSSLFNQLQIEDNTENQTLYNNQLVSEKTRVIANEGLLIETELALEEVVEETVSSEKQKHVCEDCNFESAYRQDYDRHMRIHTGKQLYSCEVCDKKFVRQDKLVIHQRIHSGDKRYKCQLCEYTAIDGNGLRQHLRIHTDDRPYKCQMCSYRARSASHLTVHHRTHKVKKGQSIDTELALEEDDGEVIEETVSNKKQKHVCVDCSFEAVYHRDYVRHRRKHTGERPYKCGVCEKKFARQDKLVIHERIHSKDKRYKCQLCDYATTDNSALRQHIRIHMDDRPYKCQMCSYRGRSASHLTVHLRTHTGDSPFFCQLDTCGRTFKTSVDLKRHMKVHKVDTLPGAQLSSHDRLACHHSAKGGGIFNKFSCLVCQDNSFKGQSSKKPKSKSKCRVGFRCAKAFKCQYCSAAFVRQDSLRSHVKQHSVSISPPDESAELV